MSRSIEDMQEQIALMLNEIGADQAVLRFTLQCLVMNVAQASGPAIVQSLRGQVLSSIDNTLPADAPEAQGAERHKQLTRIRAEQLFQEIDEALGIPQTAPTTKGAN